MIYHLSVAILAQEAAFLARPRPVLAKPIVMIRIDLGSDTSFVA